MYYHASPTANITQLEPRVSNHEVPLVYFSTKRENVLVYLCNAIEKYCKENGFKYNGKWEKWGAYGFNQDGTQRLEEYYPNALEKTYKGVSGYIYSTDLIVDSGCDLHIPYAVSSSSAVTVTGIEFVPDAYKAILEAENRGLITILRYEEISDKTKDWINRTILREYEEATGHPEYRFFLKGNFPDVIKE